MSSEYAPPSTYFDGIYYNPYFFTSTNSNTLSATNANNLYLKRTGSSVNSVANLTTFNNNLTVSGILNTNLIQPIGTLLIGNSSSGPYNATSLTIGASSGFNDTSLSTININAKRNGNVNIGSSGLNSASNINITAGQYTITIGGGSIGHSGILNLGSGNTTGYVITSNLATGSQNNILNIGSTTSILNVFGTLLCNSFLPTSTITASTSNQFMNLTCGNGLITTLKSSANTWTSTNTFNTNLPTSTLTPSSGTQLITKTYADGLISNLLISNNSWSGTNTFNNTTTFNGGITNFYAKNDTSSFTLGNVMQNLTSGNSYYNIAIGSFDILSSATNYTYYNTVIGNDCLNAYTDYGQNIAIGTSSLKSLLTGGKNCAIGWLALQNLTSGENNFCAGTASGAGLESGSANFLLGFQTMASFNTPQITRATNVNNTLALGVQAHTMVGHNTQNNVSVGYKAGGNPFSQYNAMILSNNNTFLGTYSGYGFDGTGGNAVFIGYNCGTNDGTIAQYDYTNNYTNITGLNTGKITSPSSNAMFFGNSAVTQNYFNGNLNIPNAIFTNLPTCSNTVTSASQLVNKTYSDGLITNLLSSANTWTGNTNTFNNTVVDKLNNFYILSNGTKTINISNVTNSLLNTYSTLYGNDNLTNATILYTNQTIYGYNNLNAMTHTVLGTFTENNIFGNNNLTSFNGSNLYSNTIIGLNNINNIITGNVYYNSINSLNFGNSLPSAAQVGYNTINGQQILSYSTSSITDRNCLFGQGILNDITNTGTFSDNVILGYQAGAQQNLISSTNCTFLGTQSQNTPFFTSTTLSYATCLGSDSNASVSNSINLGRENGSDTTYIYGNVNLQNQLLLGSFNSNLTTITISKPYFTVYTLTATSCTINLPLLSSVALGMEFNFYFSNGITGTFAFIANGTDTILGNGYGVTLSPLGTYILSTSRSTDITLTKINSTNWYVKSSSLNVGNIVQGSLNIIQQTQTVNLAYGTLITASTFSAFVSSKLYTGYSFQLSVSCVCTLPAADGFNLGVEIIMRRVSATNAGTTLLTSASSNIYPFNSMTAGTTLLSINVYTVTIKSMLITSSTYGWFIV